MSTRVHSGPLRSFAVHYGRLRSINFYQSPRRPTEVHEDLRRFTQMAHRFQMLTTRFLSVPGSSAETRPEIPKTDQTLLPYSYLHPFHHPSQCHKFFKKAPSKNMQKLASQIAINTLENGAFQMESAINAWENSNRHGKPSNAGQTR